MSMLITEKVEYVMNGDYIGGVVKKNKWSWEFFPDEAFMNINRISSISLEGYIKDLQEIKDFLDAKKVAEKLTGE